MVEIPAQGREAAANKKSVSVSCYHFILGTDNLISSSNFISSLKPDKVLFPHRTYCISNRCALPYRHTSDYPMPFPLHKEEWRHGTGRKV